MLWADVVSVITIISFRPVLVANGLMGGGVPLLLGTNITILKAPCGGTINREQSFFLDVVHINIAFEDCVSVGSF